MLALCVSALVLLLGVPLIAEAQSVPSLPRIGVLANALDTADGPLFQGFLEALRALGYSEDRNVAIDWRSSEGDDSQLPGLAADLVRARVDVILATSLRPALAAVEATKTIPIVFVVAADPVGLGLVPNLTRPGGNVTGLAVYRPRESTERALDLLKTLTPRASHLAVLNNPSNPVHRELLSQVLPGAAQRSKLTLIPLALQSPAELPSVFDRARRKQADAIYVLGDVLAFINRARIVELAAKHRLPAVYSFRSAAEAGGLMAYSPDLRELFVRAAGNVDKILKGSKPGEIPVTQSGKYELLINMRTARALGLAVPLALTRQANVVIE